jgi:hypothetical protein
MPAFADAYLIPEFIVNPVPQSGGSKEPKRAKTAETVLNILEGRIGVRRLAVTTLPLVINPPKPIKTFPMLSMSVHLLESQEKSRNLDRWAASKAESGANATVVSQPLLHSFRSTNGIFMSFVSSFDYCCRRILYYSKLSDFERSLKPPLANPNLPLH